MDSVPTRVCSVSFRYPHGKFLLNDISFDIPPGTRFGIIGANGSGKSTLLKLLGGHLRPSSGAIWRGSQEITHYNPGRRGMATVFQDLALFPHLNVEQNVQFGLIARGNLARSAVNERVDEYIKRFGLNNHRTKRPADLSGGEKQRVALARAIICSPSILLLDEPTASLDTQQKDELAEVLDDIAQGLPSTSMVIVTHDYSFALSLCERMAVLENGRLVACGEIPKLFAQPPNLSVAAILGGYTIIRGTVKGPQFVSADGLVAFEVAKLSTAGVKQACAAIIRADSFRVGSSAADDECRLSGRVTHVQFRGTHTRIIIENGNQRIITDIAGAAPKAELGCEIGKELTVWFSLCAVQLIETT